MGAEFDIGLVLRLLLASLLGGLLGLEREVHGRPAGFRTHLLVSLGACLFALTSVEFYRIYGGSAATVDRVASQVVTGIGFLGAGAIIREKASVRGLTTAACLWVAAALGIACGIGLFYLAICVTAVALASLMLLKRVENLLRRDSYFLVMVWGDDREAFASRVTAALASCGIVPLAAKYDKNVELQRLYIEFQVKRAGKGSAVEVFECLSLLAGVKRVRVE